MSTTPPKRAASTAKPAADPIDRLRALRRSRALVIERLSMAIDYRERGISNRAQRITRYAWLLARAAGGGAEDCDLASLAAPLHDVGMVGVPSAIMLKAGPLDAHEWVEIRRHPELGAELIGEHDDPLLRMARTVALTHHERWDGSGYPRGLSGEKIPWAGRLMALIDAFEAMTVTQRHSPPISGIDAARRIIAAAGKQFDPGMVAAFRKALPKMVKVAEAYPDKLAGMHDLDFAD